MSPTVFRYKNCRFFFFSREEPRIHIHVLSEDGEAKFWIEPEIELAASRGLKGHLITELKKALQEVKQLKGFIPICASCKKIRNDRGFWEQVESYISKHSDATFSHGVCPECMETLYSELEEMEEEIGNNK